MVQPWNIQRFQWPSIFSATSVIKSLWSLQLSAMSSDATCTNINRHESLNPTTQVRFRCNKQNPADHSLSDNGLFYQLSEETSNRLISNTSNAKSFPKKFLELAEIFNEKAVMIRKPGLELVNYLKHTTQESAVNRYLIYGKSGSGKTMVLQYAIDYCISQGWLVVPSFYTWDWVIYQHPYKEHRKQELIVSQFNKDRIDQPEMATRWLETFRLINQPLLNKIYTTKKYVWSKHDESEKGTSFLSLVEFGVSRPRNASDVIGCLMREVRFQDHSTMPPTLVAVDSVNALFGPTQLKMPYLPKLNVEELTVPYNLLKLLSNTWKNGAVVVAVDTLPMRFFWKHKVSDEHPFDILGRKAFDLLDPHVPVHVPYLSENEVNNFLLYLEDRKWLFGRSLTHEAKEEIKQLTNNPRELITYCGGLY